jgi:hypothetical protein
MYAALSDVTASRARFESSDFIRQLWPPEMRVASLPYFEFQHVIDAHLYGELVAQGTAIEDVHLLLSRSSLAAPVLWRLASSADVQSMLARVSPAQRNDPLLQYHLGVRLLSDRNYLAAAAALARAQEVSDVGDNAFVLRVYALCMGEQVDQARVLARAAFAQALKDQGLDPAATRQVSLPPFWEWLRLTFGIDPRVN